MKFGKEIQKKQLEIPEYAAAFVDYKALKKVIKGLKNSPAIQAEVHLGVTQQSKNAQSVLQANKAPFFFRLDRELDKVNAFYTVKEQESKVRLKVLVDKQKAMRLREPNISKNSTHYLTLEQGFRDFIHDLGKLQQFIEINAIAFSKILKKVRALATSRRGKLFDQHRSGTKRQRCVTRSRRYLKQGSCHVQQQTKELYISRAVEVQPCFNHDVVSDLSDKANVALLDCAAWSEGDRTHYGSETDETLILSPRLEQDETDSELLSALNRGDVEASRGLVRHLSLAANAAERLTRVYLTAVSSAPESGLKLLLDTNVIDLHRQDEINERNCLHKTAMTGRLFLLRVGLESKVDPSQADAYGRIPLHYACMNGHHELVSFLVDADRSTVDRPDLDKYTALIHSVKHGHLQCVEKMLSYSAKADADQATDHHPLNLACQFGSVPIAERLLQRHPRIKQDAEGLYPQHLVARFGTDPRLLLMLRDYSSVEPFASLDQPDKLYQWTPLFHAASEGRTDCLRTLLECGVDPHVKDEKGLSALYYATWEGHLECMNILTAAMQKAAQQSTGENALQATAIPPAPILTQELDVIPALSLPPPIIPTRRYGHNFLDTKTTVVVTFDDTVSKPVAFYDETKYPAARLTISPRATDVLPRNLLLPISIDDKSLTFEMNRFDSFALDFDVYPTFGKKVIAKGSAPREVFQDTYSSSGTYHLSLFDPRLRPVGQMCFKYQVIRPYAGVPLDITPFATYWKATSQLESQPSSLVTGSSMSGEYVRVYVQLSKDNVPVLYPSWTINVGEGCDVSVMRLTASQYMNFGRLAFSKNLEDVVSTLKASQDVVQLGHDLMRTVSTLQDLLEALPLSVQLNIHLLYPTAAEELELGLGPTANINVYADSLLHVIFDHARKSRECSGNTAMRSIAFTSYNKELCMALNWKQPNYPVLLCNDLGADENSMPALDPRHSLSLKEAVRVAQLNNLMGLVCRSKLFDSVPSLIEAIKVSGLVLVSDASSGAAQPPSATASMPQQVPEGIDGVLQGNGILRFNETIEV